MLKVYLFQTKILGNETLYVKNLEIVYLKCCSKKGNIPIKFQILRIIHTYIFLY